MIHAPAREPITTPNAQRPTEHLNAPQTPAQPPARHHGEITMTAADPVPQPDARPQGLDTAVRGVQAWMALDLHTALGRDTDHSATCQNQGFSSWADWWADLIGQVRNGYQLVAYRTGAVAQPAAEQPAVDDPKPSPYRQLVDDVAAQLHDEDPAGYHGDGGPGDCKRCAAAGGEQA